MHLEQSITFSQELSQRISTQRPGTAIQEEKYYGDLSYRTQHRIIKYLNNIVEQDHRFIMRKTNQMLGFKSYGSAKDTIRGIKIMHMIHKGQIEMIQDVLTEAQFISDLMAEAINIGIRSDERCLHISFAPEPKKRCGLR